MSALQALDAGPPAVDEEAITTDATLSLSEAYDDPVQACQEKHANYPYAPGQSYCNATFDTFLCWPPTPAGQVATQNCPPARLSDTTRNAFRRCGESGMWLGKRPADTSAVGWTNYTPCFPSEVQTLFVKVYEEQDENDAQLKFDIARRTRYLEIAGFSISLVALLLSLFIFSYYRSLRNKRTRIHKNLFTAMVVQVLIRLTVYIDQALFRGTTDADGILRGIDNMPYLCESSYVLLEYATTAMFMWMFIEGLFLHNMVTAYTLREHIPYTMYYVTGWGLPVLVTAVWATTTAIHYSREHVKRCWYGYNFSPIYWIMQGPRLAVIMINMVFLLNIMRVLIVKLRRSNNTEVEKVRKGVRAALVLLPLLGITNVLNMTEAPLDGSYWGFGIWSYSTHFLRSFQGFFIALIYCFLNGEVRQVLKKHYNDYMAMRTDARRHRDSLLHFVSSSGEGSAASRELQQEEPKSAWIKLKEFKWKRGSSKTMVFDTETGSDNGSERKRYKIYESREQDEANVQDGEQAAREQNSQQEEPKSAWIKLKEFKWKRGSSKTMVFDTETGSDNGQERKRHKIYESPEHEEANEQDGEQAAHEQNSQQKEPKSAWIKLKEFKWKRGSSKTMAFDTETGSDNGQERKRYKYYESPEHEEANEQDGEQAAREQKPQKKEPKSAWIKLKEFKWKRGSSKTMAFDTETGSDNGQERKRYTIYESREHEEANEQDGEQAAREQNSEMPAEIET